MPLSQISRLALAALCAAALYAAMHGRWLDAQAAIAIAAGFAILAAIGSGVALTAALRQKREFSIFATETSQALDRLEKRSDARYAELVSGLSSLDAAGTAQAEKAMAVPGFRAKSASLDMPVTAKLPPLTNEDLIKEAPDHAGRARRQTRSAAKAWQSALANGQLPVSFQPIFNTQSGAVTAFIARARLGDNDLSGTGDLPEKVDAVAFAQMLSAQVVRISRQLMAGSHEQQPILCPLNTAFLKQTDAFERLMTLCRSQTSSTQSIFWEVDAQAIVQDGHAQAGLAVMGAAGFLLAFRGSAQAISQIPSAAKRHTAFGLLELAKSGGAEMRAVELLKRELPSAHCVLAALDDGRADFAATASDLGINHLTSLEHGPARLVKPVLAPDVPEVMHAQMTDMER